MARASPGTLITQYASIALLQTQVASPRIFSSVGCISTGEESHETTRLQRLGFVSQPSPGMSTRDACSTDCP